MGNAFGRATEKEMYLSGPPLHVLAMRLVQRWRRSFGDSFTVSFSAGIERTNYPDAVALGLVPVTACTDLLKPGGYGRGLLYFHELTRRMAAAGASNIDEFIVRAYGDDGPEELALARLRNTDLYVESLGKDPRYQAASHRELPRKTGRRLRLFACETCDRCVPVCPNDANFSVRVASTPTLALTEARQIVNFADCCNACGNCDVFCPEVGGPNQLKARVFVNRERWQRDAPRDAVLMEPDATTGRFDGEVLRVDAGEGPGDDPRAHALHGLRQALLGPGEVNYVSEYLRTAAERCGTEEIAASAAVRS